MYFLRKCILPENLR